MVREVSRVKGYLYLLWRTGEFSIYEGEVVTSDYAKNERYLPTRSSYFVVNDDKRYCCWTKPGIVYNKMVWLPERDDDKGRQLLLAYEEECVKQLQEKINNHIAIINLLKGDAK